MIIDKNPLKNSKGETWEDIMLSNTGDNVPDAIVSFIYRMQMMYAPPEKLEVERKLTRTINI